MIGEGITFRERVYELLDERDLSITNLAGIIGLPRSTICSWLNSNENKRVQPNITTLIILAEGLNLSVSELLYGVNKI